MKTRQTRWNTRGDVDLGRVRPFSWVHCDCEQSKCEYGPPAPGVSARLAKRLIYLGPIPNQRHHVLCLDEKSGAPFVAHGVVEIHEDDT